MNKQRTQLIGVALQNKEIQQVHQWCGTFKDRVALHKLVTEIKCESESKYMSTKYRICSDPILYS